MPPREPELPLGEAAQQPAVPVPHPARTSQPSAEVIPFPRFSRPADMLVIAPNPAAAGYLVVGPEPRLSASFSTIEAAVGFARGIARALGLKTDVRISDAKPPVVEVLEREQGWTVIVASPDDTTIIATRSDREHIISLAERIANATGWQMIDWSALSSGAA